MIARLRLLCAALTLGGFAVLPAAGQVRGTGSGTSGSNSPTYQASQAVQAAQVTLRKAQTDITRAKNKVRAELLAKPQWATVNAEVNKAQTQLKAAERAALAALAKKPEYQAALQQRADASKIRQQAAAGTTASTGDDTQAVSAAELQKADDTYIKASYSIKAMEKQALADNQAYIDAKAKLEAAHGKMSELDAQVDETLKSDPAYMQLQTAFDQAQQAVVQAREQLASARQAAQQQRQQESKSRQNSSGPGR
jgi:hypothetical protein